MKKKLIWPFVVIALSLLIVGSMLHFHLNYLIWEEKIYPRDLQSLDLSGQTLPDLELLRQFTQLQELDLRNTDLTGDQYDRLRENLPQCDILWHIPFRNTFLSPDTRELTLTEFSEDDIQSLQLLPRLEKVTVIGCTDTELTKALAAALPNCQIYFQHKVGGTLLSSNIRIYQSTNLLNIASVLELFPQIPLIDATDCPNFTALAALQAQYPDTKILYTVPLGGVFWRECSTEITVESVTGEELAKVIPALPWLRSIRVTQPVPDPDRMLQLRQEYPDIRFVYSFDLLGKTVSSDTETINISRVKLKNTEEFERYLPHFDNLKRVEMCRCGISNGDMDALKQRYPDIFFVWEVKIGHAWIRTDVKYFMPYQHRLVLYDYQVDNLKYLTELICLDLGHMKMTRTDYLAYMPKLQYLLMCGTPISDISYCANMKDLKYVELFITNVTDFSPLLECKNLVDLNVSYTHPADPLIFAQMTQLENLWFRNMKDQNVRNQLRAALPNTKMVFNPGSSTGGGWRKLPNYYAQRDILHMPYMEED